MKKYIIVPLRLICILVIINYAIWGNNTISAQDESVFVKFEFYSPDSDSGSILWGIDGWKIPEELICPANTKIDNVLRTPFSYDKGVFSLTLEVPAGSEMDYGILLQQKGNFNDAYFQQSTLLIDSSVEKIDLGTIVREPKVIGNYFHLIIFISLGLWGLLIFAYRQKFAREYSF
jgi:hypothetical protein